MNGAKYMNCSKRSCTIFMQDVAPCAVISLLEWSGNNPDLNPVENLWTIVKDKVAYKQPSSNPGSLGH